MNLTISLFFIVLFFTGCATHKTAENLLDESTISFRLKKLESKNIELSKRIETLEQVKHSGSEPNKTEQFKLFFGIIAAIASVLILIYAIVDNFGKFLFRKIPWGKKKCDPG